MPATSANRSQRTPGGAPFGGTVIRVKWSRPTASDQRDAMSERRWCFQNQRPGFCAMSSLRTASRNSSQVRTPRFCVDSVHIAGSERARSRAVSTTCRSVPAKASLIISIFGSLRGARNSMETIAVPGHSLTTSTRCCQGPSGVIGSWLGPPRSISSRTARTCWRQRSQANRMPCSASRSRLAVVRSTFWMKLVPDFIAPMWSTSRFATPGSIGHQRVAVRPPRKRRSGVRNRRRRPCGDASSDRRLR